MTTFGRRRDRHYMLGGNLREPSGENDAMFAYRRRAGNIDGDCNVLMLTRAAGVIEQLLPDFIYPSVCALAAFAN